MKTNKFFIMALLGAMVVPGASFEMQASQSWYNWGRSLFNPFKNAMQSSGASDLATSVMSKLNENKKLLAAISASALLYWIGKKIRGKLYYKDNKVTRDYIGKIKTYVQNEEADLSKEGILSCLPYDLYDSGNAYNAYNYVKDENKEKNIPAITEDDVLDNRFVIVFYQKQEKVTKKMYGMEDREMKDTFTWGEVEPYSGKTIKRGRWISTFGIPSWSSWEEVVRSGVELDPKINFINDNPKYKSKTEENIQYREIERKGDGYENAVMAVRVGNIKNVDKI